MEYDILIIGAGVIGCVIAREMSRYRLTIGVLEQSVDLVGGTSRANSGIVHAGYDAPPGTLMAELNVAGAELMAPLCQQLRVSYRQTGSLVVAEDGPHSRAELERLLMQGVRNGVKRLRLIWRDKLRHLVPLLNPELTIGLYAPTTAIVSPYQLTIALAENAAQNGVKFFLGKKVTDITELSRGLQVNCGGEGFTARLVINAAGVQADVIARMLEDYSFSITPHKGQELIMDKQCGNLTSMVLFPLPSPISKGIVVAPTAAGNLLIGPTAEAVKSKQDKATSYAGQQQVLKAAQYLIPAISSRAVITGYAGLRAVADTGDFIIRYANTSRGLLHVAGIKSPGLSAAPAIARRVADLVRERISLVERPDFRPERPVRPVTRELGLAEWQQLIELDPAYGKVICRCEQITEGEIRDALTGPLAPSTLDGLKLRLRVGMGRCQGGFCLPQLIELMQKYKQFSQMEVSKLGTGSEFLVGKLKSVQATSDQHV